MDSLDESSDFSGFMSPKVSEELRRLALRKLFSLPKYNITDGLDDYNEDFTNFAKLGNILTHEMRRALEREQERLLQGGEGTLKEEFAGLEEAIAGENAERTDSATEQASTEPDNGADEECPDDPKV